jgi:[glutamine synthetase] adenylyltransferase / [glutamine synthetase]-adenylyl-L-tyrosine phosphorylase
MNPAFEQWQVLLADDTMLIDSADRVLNGSDYVRQWGERNPDRASALFASGDVQDAYTLSGYDSRLTMQLHGVLDEAVLQQQLRYFRQREMVRIIWRDLSGWADLAETVRELSALADACIQQALAKLYGWHCKSLGTPFDDNGEPQNLVVLGMGKLGAGELNLSSDIDLIFTHASPGNTQGCPRSVSHEVFFTRLGQKLIQALDNVTTDGFVFRVDMRLRPFGDSGALVSCFDAMEDYYQTQGREWERYAMIKARVITGNDAEKENLTSLLKPFVYRRYLDYGVFDSLREMKGMIVSQLRRKGVEGNIKLGVGGIREIEFIGQVFQLIYGGRDQPLQQRPILTILDLLAERQCLSEQTVDDLKQAYAFLRRTEHRIQAFADQQTHLLPSDDEGLLRLAQLMDFDSTADFLCDLNAHREQVQDHFEQILTSPQAEAQPIEETSLFSSTTEEKVAYLAELGFEQTQQGVALILGLFDNHAYRNLGEVEHQRLATLLPLLVKAASHVANPDDCLNRLIPLLESILRRSAYMSLLVENSLALSQLVRLCAASPWISSQLALHPMLLDELLDPRTLYDVPDRGQQVNKLADCIATVDKTDLEQHMSLLREFRQITALHVAAADVTQVLPLMRVGDQLTELAEIQLEQVLALSGQHLVAHHGRPPCTDNDDLSQCGFSVLAYGKLGGLELGYGSDLDLVFLFDDKTNIGMTDGARPVEPLMFYTRLAQRMIHLMNTVTAGGILYEVDMRLRPNGQSGLLVADISGFEVYQKQDAWTWEHQALVRARCVAGDTILSKKIKGVRAEILAQKRDLTTLVKDVSEMRAKMREQLNKSTAELFDLKQGEGGITDIEFMVQYAALAWSSDWESLLVYTDNIRMLEALKASDKLSEHDSNMLARAYRFYRKLANHCILQEEPAVVPLEQVAAYRTQVAGIWQRWFG